MPRLDPSAPRAHRFGKAGEFLFGFALAGQRNERGGNLRIGRRFAQHRFEQGSGFGLSQVLFGNQFVEKVWKHG